LGDHAPFRTGMRRSSLDRRTTAVELRAPGAAEPSHPPVEARAYSSGLANRRCAGAFFTDPAPRLTALRRRVLAHCISAPPTTECPRFHVPLAKLDHPRLQIRPPRDETRPVAGSGLLAGFGGEPGQYQGPGARGNVVLRA
jgi:hypothetical protein